MGMDISPTPLFVFHYFWLLNFFVLSSRPPLLEFVVSLTRGESLLNSHHLTNATNGSSYQASCEAKKTVAKKKKVESTKAKSIFAWKEKEESSEEEYAKIIEPMDDLVDYTDYYTSSEEELTASGARFVSIVRKG
ncbi:hypothetical protein P8452_68381 [Trifolium repens]|nr:hypothetical protein P8452_68381 [Trifolium repens]